ncbi:MAG: retropepsin-like domain-containing protein [Candidatus Omnitrophica bacterium]|nr:retropepsin-like domain-containing protein [Candidatus Omnitrophota bacterium]MBU1047612.1 retropepsin-like domain-containing protein [Candidatus Omnitrophota bacterium]MBU1631480.1 retropepsin-like domain-containing protein [Candidatus Omnitrophota bacterium]MBU1767246.1 retropepsin-like domain-containing protein [Candidatus Omnitrophota bacterium]MBU1888974.1 retropepsin-like domain-containing protein [Candidatus Omnitrophota bacterium]
MKFKYQRIPVASNNAFPNRKSIIKPLIPIRLRYQKNFVDIYALIDSGADDCLFNAEIGAKLGIDITSGEENSYRGITGQSTIAYFHKIEIEVGGWKHPCYAGFCYDTPLSALGQDGFFNLFKIQFNYSKSEIEIKNK